MRYYLFLFSILFISACYQPHPAWQEDYDAVMVIHDEVMPEIGTITKLKKKLKTHSNQEGIDSLTQAKITNLRRALTKGEDGMWDWMHNFKKPKKEDKIEAVKAYLIKEKEKISTVSVLMKTSIKETQRFLEN